MLAGSFRVPHGLDPTGRLISAAEATKGGVYRCPPCDSRLSLHAGPIVARHFAHLSTASCATETVIHHTAKHLIAQTVSDWRSGTGERPAIGRRCSRCIGYVYQPLPERITTAWVEYRLADGLVADVALMDGDDVAAIVEVFVSHAVDPDKVFRLEGVPWIEVSGVAVLSSPVRWNPIASGGLRHTRDRLCEECIRVSEEHEAKVEQIATRWMIDLPGHPYRVIASQCYRCQADLLLFDWGEMWGKRRPPHPVPRTVQRQKSMEYGGSYWVNTCPRCRRIQGDWYIRHYFDNPEEVVWTLTEPRKVRGAL